MLADESHLDECALPLTSSVTSSILSSPTAIVGVGIGGLKGLFKVGKFVTEGMSEVIIKNSLNTWTLSTTTMGSMNFNKFNLGFNLTSKLTEWSLSNSLNNLGIGLNLNSTTGTLKTLSEVVFGSAFFQDFSKKLGSWAVLAMLGGIGWAW